MVPAPHSVRAARPHSRRPACACERGLRAQETINYASISGRVTDPQGSVVVGASVTARQTETNVADSVTTDGAGRFRFAYLRVGPYEIKVTQPGFSPYVRQLNLNAGAAFDIPVTLAVAGLEAAVAVTADGPVLESARSQVATTVSQQEVNNLPLNGRNFLDIAVLAPAVAPPNINSTQLFAETSAVQGVGLSVGQPAQPLQQLRRRRPLVERRCGRASRHAVRSGRGRAVPGGHLRRPGRARASARRLPQRRYTQRHEPAARHRLRLLPRRCLQCGQRALGHDAADVAATVRRQPGRPDREGAARSTS